jgi:cytochrome c-type biogenesis protein CcmH/NrfG
MKQLAIVLLMLLGSSTCGSEADHAKADRLPPEVADAPKPSAASLAAAHAWQASYSAEAAGNLEAALNAMSELPGPQSAGYLATYRRGWLQYRLGRFSDSVAAYNTAVLLEPSAVEARVAQLVPLMAQQKWHEVEAGAEEVLKRDPENWLALQRLAFAKFSTQHFPESEQLYRRIVQLYPSDVESRAGLGWAALRMGKQKEAAALFTEVLEMSANHQIAARGLYEANRKKAKQF